MSLYWDSDGYTEPPYGINHVRESGGSIADRVYGPCEGQYGSCNGGVWRWRHNGNSACWRDLDGVGPWTGWDRDNQR